MLLVKAAFQQVINFQKLHDKRPTQFVRQRRTNWVNQIKLAEARDIASAKTLTMTQAEVTAEIFQQSLAITCPDFAILLELNNVVADLPICGGELGIDRLMSPELAGGINLGNSAEKTLISGVGSES